MCPVDEGRKAQNHRFVTHENSLVQRDRPTIAIKRMPLGRPRTQVRTGNPGAPIYRLHM